MSQAAEKPSKADRRKELLDAAYKEFIDKGYVGASMEAIARRAHASKETLYSWFGDKGKLFQTLFETRLNELGDRVTPAAEKDPSPANVLPIIAEDVLRFSITIAPLTIATGAPRSEASRIAGRAISDERKRFVGYIEWCKRNGYIAFDDDPFEITSLFVAMAEGEWAMRLATGMLDKLTDDMIKRHAQRVTRIFLKALAPEKKP